MTKNPIVYVKHIHDCINKIQEYTQGVNQDDFLKNSLLQDGVIRNLEIIGEATKHLDQQFRRKYPLIEWKKIAGMRDKLIHDYIGVDLFAVWGVVERVIPVLEKQIERIIKEEDSES
jgi:uncharacterized protein with HEPN domain